MLTIPGYRILDRIYSRSKTDVYRGIAESDEKPVVIKVLSIEYPTFHELVQFRNQYSITKNLNVTGVVKTIALEKYRNSFALVMEDIGGISLAEYVANLGVEQLDDRSPNSSKSDLKKASKLAIPEFLQLAIQIVKILEELSQNQIIHKDIKPQNILINPKTKQVKLIDFSISSLLPQENQEIQNPKTLEGTLAYISPEQTGRMNRCIDYRTDFYSLGITFYELLTGQLPFVSADPLELIHCHIAKKPTEPIELNSAIPAMVNDIIMKLISKTAELRYQSAFGIRYDLENCWQQWQETNSISQFDLGSRDICDRFIIPEKLYGRETEVQKLLEAFDRISEGNIEIMLIAGFSGIGKTAVVNEVHKPIVRQRGYFIKGKFDQFQRDIPFYAWVQAFQNLMRQLLTESAAEVQKWQLKILEALGENGQVIIDVIPELEHLIGKQPKAPEIEGIAAQNRFNLLLQNFIRVLATKEHPLVIFLDDLQWADSASLKLMQLLMSETDTRYLLLMGAYRDNEVFPTHPLMLTLDEIRKIEANSPASSQNQDIDRPVLKVDRITLAPLDLLSLNCLIADTLSCPTERAMPLTELIFAKTKGNPFFATKFLKFLHSDGFISFNFTPTTPHYQGEAKGGWQCDIAKLRALSWTDDVVEFMAIQLQKLPVNTQEVLKLAACIGNEFDLATLAIVYEKSQTETAADLWKALQEGLVIPITEVYKFFQDSESVAVAKVSELSVTYKFLHDRVQQAAYFLIPEVQKQSTHLKIGRLLLRNIPESEKEEKIFDLVKQLNIGKELITHQTERDKLAKLNLIAGRKAKASTAYAAAKSYLTVGLELLAVDSWQNNYELTLALYELAAQTAYLYGDFEQMEKFANIVIQQAISLLDKVKVYDAKIQASSAQGNLKEAMKIGQQVLKQLGVNLPESPSQLESQKGLEETALLCSQQKIEELINLSEMTENEPLAALHILSSIAVTAYISAPNLLILVVCKMVNLSLKYGNAIWSSVGYSAYGLILCGGVQDIEQGYEFGCLAANLVERFNGEKVKAKVFNIVGGHIKHWKEHLRETLPILIEGYESGVESGDFEMAGCCAFNICNLSYFSGQELMALKQKISTYCKAISYLQQEVLLKWIAMVLQAILNLLGLTENPRILIGDVYNEEQELANAIANNDRNQLHYLYLNKLILNYLFGEAKEAKKNALSAEIYLDGVTAMIAAPIFHFYDSLAHLAVFAEVSNLEQEVILNRIKVSQEKIQKWADYAPMNYLHKFYLVEAERHRVLGGKLEAIEMYDRAISLAKENGYLNEEALAHELAAKFYLGWGKKKIAQVYLTDAYYAYARWGAKAKVEDLEKRYPQLLDPILNQKKSIYTDETIALMNSGTISSTSSNVSELLDLGTIMKASQTLSGEIQLDKLLSILMQVVMENAGAEKCNFILQKAGNLVIEATGISGAEIKVLESIPIETSNELPQSVINYVFRTQEYVIFNDLYNEINQPESPIQNVNDPYIIQHQPKSVLCLPIQHQGKAIGILYLENNLAIGAFTPDRLELLKVLSSQAAISIENAQLYANLEAKVEERTLELSQALSNLKATQEGLIQSEKMAALGQLVAGVAHEVNTPLGAIRSSAGNVSKFLDQTLEDLPALFQSFSLEEGQIFSDLLHRSLQQSATLSTKEERKLKRALRSQLETSEIEMVDTVADRLVMMGVYDEIDCCLPLLQRQDSLHLLETAYKLSELKRGIATINTATDRASKVVFALKTYARYEQSGEKTTASIAEGIETILTLYQNQLKQGVEVVTNYAKIPPILCYPDELNQVWTNLIHNALQAMDNRGTLTIGLTEHDRLVKISVTDSGKGIPEEIKAKIFEPFFTTKAAGEGSGLGLDIVKKIVEKHQGKIELESIPGKTTFNIFLPIVRV